MTPTMLARAAALAATCTLALPLAACSSVTATPTTAATTATTKAADDSPSAKALEKYVAAVQAQIPELMKSFGDTYTDFTITADAPSTIVYEYTFTNKVNKSAAAKQLDGMKGTYQSTLDDQVFPEMEKAGITDPHARYTYLNPDGSKVWSHTFSKS
ncbi:MAG: DUF4854 domain-containing protein [Actinobacteria bacterium]|nr:DUF4854 domain-containing protein [Actinomycetota bacterium]